MCHERYLRRRDADEHREIRHDFEHTRPVADPDEPPEVTEPERTEAQQEIAIAES
jgi:cell division protein FtsN